MTSLTIFTLVVVTLLGLTRHGAAAEIPIAGHTYAIRSAQEGAGYLAPLGTGGLCKSLSPVQIMPTSAPFGDEFLWNLRSWIGGTFVLDNQKHGNGNDGSNHVVNDLSYDNSFPPYCYLIYNQITFVPADNKNGAFNIHREWSREECLSFRWGVGLTVWEECGGEFQDWILEPVVQSNRL